MTIDLRFIRTFDPVCSSRQAWPQTNPIYPLFAGEGSATSPGPQDPQSPIGRSARRRQRCDIYAPLSQRDWLNQAERAWSYVTRRRNPQKIPVVAFSPLDRCRWIPAGGVSSTYWKITPGRGQRCIATPALRRDSGHTRRRRQPDPRFLAGQSPKAHGQHSTELRPLARRNPPVCLSTQCPLDVVFPPPCLT